MLRLIAYATIEFVTSVSTTAPTVISALFNAACGKFVRSQASEKLAQRGSAGNPKPDPDSSSGVFKAVTTAK
ncbi:hypothetical protein SAMN05421812_105414 [Asanoa hainanensis]|uniref:Uncharacterized protein n=1 Tax=Asanoa hainanensis TaxID=560556 RepID=A0A239MGL7_9ACTN|nr:hypothetical protein [Asanoa hainanensis]SNT41323.1 hypothetical protein SAMN05421812_105414 [Asanoa hainanensis]